MEQQSSLENLAIILYSNAKKISLFCQQQDYPQRSLDIIEPASLLPTDAPQHMLVAQQSIAEAATKIQQLVVDPADFMGTFQIQYQQLACLRWLCHFDILSHIPLTGSTSYETVATAASVPIYQLRSIARMAMTRNFLREPVYGEMAHSSISAAFIKNPSLNDWALFMTSTSAIMASQTVEATEKYGATSSKTETTYNVWKNTDKAFFDEVKGNKDLTRQFANYMKNVTSGKATSIQHLVTGFDWASLGEITIVDLGGSNGHASIALANAFPDLKFIVQDLWDTIESARPDMSALSPSVSSRITYQYHNFFMPQPLQDVDVFLLRMIIHDWPTAEATEIIKNLVNSLKPGGKLIIMDTVLPRPGSVPTLTEAALRVRDLSMMQVHNSKEREHEEWIELLREADPRLQLVGVTQPFGSSMSLLEIVREDEVVNGSGHANGTANSNGRINGVVNGSGHTNGVINEGFDVGLAGKLDGEINGDGTSLAALPGTLAT